MGVGAIVTSPRTSGSSLQSRRSVSVEGVGKGMQAREGQGWKEERGVGGEEF